MNKGQKIALVAGFLILAVLYFFVGDWGCDWLICRRWVAVPTLFATLATALNFKRGGWLIPLALLASSAGDWAGAMGEFIFQIAFFAVAHIFYIADFVPKCKFTLKRTVALVLFSAIVLPFLGYVLMHIGNRVEMIAVAIYGVLIYTMGFTALLQNRKFSMFYAIAAMLFIFSDSCIAYNRFVEHIPNATMWIMTTYYAAQGIFCTLHLTREEK
ncbi:MAG: lysoplasmalogenase [Alistipes sp.]|nr:lysoplasmalogenase [Alistipes sp.]